MLREDQRRAVYERLYAEFRDARRALAMAQDRRASASELRYLTARVTILREQMRRWQENL